MHSSQISFTLVDKMMESTKKKLKSFKRRAIAKKVNEVEKKIESRCITEQKFYWWFVT